MQIRRVPQGKKTHRSGGREDTSRGREGPSREMAENAENEGRNGRFQRGPGHLETEAEATDRRRKQKDPRVYVLQTVRCSSKVSTKTTIF